MWERLPVWFRAIVSGQPPGEHISPLFAITALVFAVAGILIYRLFAREAHLVAAAA
jgi:hypothetical protein